MKLRFPKFSLLTLLLLAVAIGAGIGIYLRWEPWYLVRTTFFSPHGRFLGEFSSDYKLQLRCDELSPTTYFIGAENARVQTTLETKSEDELYLSWNHDESQVLGWDSNAQHFLVWDARSGKCLLRKPTAMGKDPNVWLTSLYNRLVINNSHEIRIFTSDGAEQVLAMAGDEADRNGTVDFTLSPNQRYIAYDMPDHRVTVYDLQENRSHPLPPEITAHTGFSADSRDLLLRSKDGYQYLDLSTFILNPVKPPAFNNGILPGIHCPGLPAFLIKNDNQLIVWDHRSNRRLAEIELVDLPGIALSPDGTRIFIYNFRGVIRVYETQTGTHLTTVNCGPKLLQIDDTHLYAANHENLHAYQRRRPEYWWGIAWLPETWVLLAALIGLSVQAFRGWRMGPEAHRNRP